MNLDHLQSFEQSEDTKNYSTQPSIKTPIKSSQIDTFKIKAWYMALISIGALVRNKQ